MTSSLTGGPGHQAGPYVGDNAYVEPTSEELVPNIHQHCKHRILPLLKHLNKGNGYGITLHFLQKQGKQVVKNNKKRRMTTQPRFSQESRQKIAQINLPFLVSLISPRNICSSPPQTPPISTPFPTPTSKIPTALSPRERPPPPPFFHPQE